jgi:uncharacterized protein (TIGR04552 family)
MQSRTEQPTGAYRPIESFSLSDLEAVRLVLRGGSVIDWYRLNFQSETEAHDFIRATGTSPPTASARRS